MRKILSLVLALALVLGSFSFVFAAPNDVAGTEYEEAVTTLNALGILTGFPDGTFRPNETITRAQFAAVVVRSLGYEEVAQISKGVTAFTDVPAEHWASGYINVASKMGYVNGMGDGTFAPESPVTYEQAITMIMRALNFEALAQKKGGYPVGYIVTAKDQGITDGVDGVVGMAAPRGIVAQLLDNALTVPMMVLDTVGGEETWVFPEEENEETLLDKLGIDKYVKRVVAIPRVDGDLEDNEIKLADVEDPIVVSEDFDFESVFGVEITAWVDGDELLVYEIEEDAIYDAVNYDDEDEVIVLVNDEDEVEYAVTEDTEIFVNGEDADLEEEAYDYAKVVVDTDEETVLFVEAYTWEDSIVVDEVEDDVVYGIGSDYTDWELDVEDFTIFKNGAIIEADDIDEGDILFFNEDDQYAEVYNNYVEGEIENVFSDTFEVDGEEYDIAGTYADGELTASVLEDMENAEEDVTVYLTRTGDVRHVVGEIEEEETTDLVVYLTEAVTDYDGRRTTYYAIDGITQDGEEVSYDVEESIVADAVAAYEGLADDEEPTDGQISDYVDLATEGVVIKITLDEDGDVDAVNFVPYDSVEFDSEVKVSAEADADEIGELEVGDRYVKVDTDDDDVYDESFRIKSSVIVFNAVDTDDVTASTWGTVEDFELIDSAEVYYDAEDYVKYIVVKDADVEESTTDYDVVITEVRRNSDDEIVRIKALVDGNNETYYVDSDVEIEMDLAAGDVVTITVEDESEEVTAITNITTINGVVELVSLSDNEVKLVSDAVYYELTDDAIVFDITDTADITVEKLRDVKEGYEVKLVKDVEDTDRFIKFLLFIKPEEE